MHIYLQNTINKFYLQTFMFIIVHVKEINVFTFYSSLTLKYLSSDKTIVISFVTSKKMKVNVKSVKFRHKFENFFSSDNQSSTSKFML